MMKIFLAHLKRAKRALTMSNLHARKRCCAPYEIPICAAFGWRIRRVLPSCLRIDVVAGHDGFRNMCACALLVAEKLFCVLPVLNRESHRSPIASAGLSGCFYQFFRCVQSFFWSTQPVGKYLAGLPGCFQPILRHGVS